MAIMQKIIFNGNPITIEEYINLYTFDDGPDFDHIGHPLDPDTLDKAMDSFDTDYDLFELIERYLQLATKPIIINEKYTTECYRQVREWDSKEEAMDFFKEAMMNSDGSEHDRYARIYEQLLDGKIYCSDTVVIGGGLDVRYK